MKYFCETESGDVRHFFISSAVPSSDRIAVYSLKDDNSKIIDLEKAIAIINSASNEVSAHNLLFVYMLLSELCVDESAKKAFSERASSLAHKQIHSNLY